MQRSIHISDIFLKKPGQSETKIARNATIENDCTVAMFRTYISSFTQLSSYKIWFIQRKPPGILFDDSTLKNVFDRGSFSYEEEVYVVLEDSDRSSDISARQYGDWIKDALQEFSTKPKPKPKPYSVAEIEDLVRASDIQTLVDIYDELCPRIDTDDDGDLGPQYEDFKRYLAKAVNPKINTNRSVDRATVDKLLVGKDYIRFAQELLDSTKDQEDIEFAHFVKESLGPIDTTKIHEDDEIKTRIMETMKTVEFSEPDVFDINTIHTFIEEVQSKYKENLDFFMKTPAKQLRIMLNKRPAMSIVIPDTDTELYGYIMGIKSYLDTYNIEGLYKIENKSLGNLGRPLTFTLCLDNSSSTTKLPSESEFLNIQQQFKRSSPLCDDFRSE